MICSEKSESRCMHAKAQCVCVCVCVGGWVGLGDGAG